MENKLIVRGPDLKRSINKWWDTNFDRFVDVIKAVKEEIPSKFNPTVKEQKQRNRGWNQYVCLNVGRMVDAKGSTRERRYPVQFLGVTNCGLDNLADFVAVYVSSSVGTVIPEDAKPMTAEKQMEYHKFLLQIVLMTLEQAGLEVIYADSVQRE